MLPNVAYCKHGWTDGWYSLYLEEAESNNSDKSMSRVGDSVRSPTYADENVSQPIVLYTDNRGRGVYGLIHSHSSIPTKRSKHIDIRRHRYVRDIAAQGIMLPKPIGMKRDGGRWPDQGTVSGAFREGQRDAGDCLTRQPAEDEKWSLLRAGLRR